MNVYDFDHTIYQGDSTLDFWRFCLHKYPRALLAFPPACVYGAAFKLHICSRERFKEQFYRFLRSVPDAAAAVEEFWNRYMPGITAWYLEQKRSDDLIVSASPEFLIGAACERLGVQCVASKVDPKTGKLLGSNCRGEEKVRRLFSAYPNAEMEEFYSDSKSDVYLARKAKKAFLVKKNVISEWSF